MRLHWPLTTLALRHIFLPFLFFSGWWWTQEYILIAFLATTHIESIAMNFIDSLGEREVLSAFLSRFG
jgi:hypothetical protein